jgi:hypothetical protein
VRSCRFPFVCLFLPSPLVLSIAPLHICLMRPGQILARTPAIVTEDLHMCVHIQYMSQCYCTVPVLCVHTRIQYMSQCYCTLPVLCIHIQYMAQSIHALGHDSGSFGSLNIFYKNWCLIYVFTLIYLLASHRRATLIFTYVFTYLLISILHSNVHLLYIVTYTTWMTQA